MKNELQVLEEITRIEYHGEPVLTTEQLAAAYECTPRNISDNFKRNEDRFVEGKHFHKLEGDTLDEFRVYSENCGVDVQPHTRHLYLWTKRGAARHAKMLSTDKAWEVFEALEDNYFNRHDRYTEDQKFWASHELERERLAFEREKFDWEREFSRERLAFDRERLGFDRERFILDREQFEDATARRTKLSERASLFRELASAAKDNFLRDDLIRHAANLLSDKSFGTKF